MLVNHPLGLAEEIDELGATPKPKRRALELQQQEAVVSYLRTALPPGTVIARVENAAAPRNGASPQQRMNFHAKRRKAGMCPGFPDLLCLLPQGRTFLLEMKAAGNVPDDRQAELHKHLRQLGHPTAVAWCVTSAAAAVRAAGLTPRQSRLDP